MSIRHRALCIGKWSQFIEFAVSPTLLFWLRKRLGLNVTAAAAVECSRIGKIRVRQYSGTYLVDDKLTNVTVHENGEYYGGYQDDMQKDICNVTLINFLKHNSPYGLLFPVRKW